MDMNDGLERMAISGVIGLGYGVLSGLIDKNGKMEQNDITGTKYRAGFKYFPLFLASTSAASLGDNMGEAIASGTASSFTFVAGMRSGYVTVQNRVYGKNLKYGEDYHKTMWQVIFGDPVYLIFPSSYNVTHRLNDVNDLESIADNYDLISLDRDLTLHGYHDKSREKKFEKTLEKISSKAEIISNSSFSEVFRINDIFGDIISVNKLVKLDNVDNSSYLIRFNKGEMKVLEYFPESEVVKDVTPQYSGLNPEELEKVFSYDYKKPDPLTVTSVIAAAKAEGKIPKENPRVLMVGDRYFTDIIAGNRAGVDTAKVWPYKWTSEIKKGKIALIGIRLVDSPIGFVMSRISELNRRLKIG